VLHHLDEAEWILWMDNDSLIVNQTLTLEALMSRAPSGKDLYVSKDFNGFNFGVFAVRSTAWTRNVFESMLLVPASNSTLTEFQDQQALTEVLGKMTVRAK
jgi:lipopolysaccharide biosynthesis glycosyltransferase